MRITPAQCRGARGLLDWKQKELAEMMGMSTGALRSFEDGESNLHGTNSNTLRRLFEDAGVIFLVSDDGAYCHGVALSPTVEGAKFSGKPQRDGGKKFVKRSSPQKLSEEDAKAMREFWEKNRETLEEMPEEARQLLERMMEDGGEDLFGKDAE